MFLSLPVRQKSAVQTSNQLQQSASPMQNPEEGPSNTSESRALSGSSAHQEIARQRQLELELDNIKTRYKTAKNGLVELREAYYRIVRTKKNLTAGEHFLCAELLVETELPSNVNGALLESVANIIEDATYALAAPVIAWAEVEIRGAEEFLEPVETKIARLKEAVSALLMECMSID